MRALVIATLMIATVSCSQFERFDGGDDDASGDGRADTVTTPDTADAIVTVDAVTIADAADVSDVTDAAVVDAVVPSDVIAADVVTVADARPLADVQVSDATDAAPDVLLAPDTGCGGSVGASCCPGAGELGRCGDSWLGCYGSGAQTCQCGAGNQVCCTGFVCHGDFHCGLSGARVGFCEPGADGG